MGSATCAMRKTPTTTAATAKKAGDTLSTAVAMNSPSKQRRGRRAGGVRREKAADENREHREFRKEFQREFASTK
ncbi:hypothetical protein V6N11_073129 [Hibiscus sabdariffa]|uniref:Uncharacterized protein n=1 Tax=Hibiscus sabdariffa TaxID=183260 RepID=A0ABR2P9I8_9ROSI